MQCKFLGKFEIAKVETVKIAFLVGGKSSFPYKLVNFRTFKNSAQFLLRKFHEEKRQTEQVKPPKGNFFCSYLFDNFPPKFCRLDALEPVFFGSHPKISNKCNSCEVCYPDA